MSDQPVVIEVKDSVDKNISRNLSEISSQARSAYQNVEKLVRQLNRVKPTAIAQFSSVVSNAERQMQQAAISAQRLATEQAKTATAAAQAAQQQARAAQATLSLEAAQKRAADASARVAAAAKAEAAAAQQAAGAEQARADRIRNMVQESIRKAEALKNETSERWKLEQAESAGARVANDAASAESRLRASVEATAKATADQRRMVAELNATLDRGVKSIEEMYRAEDLLDRAMAKGAISADQQSAALERLNSQMRMLGQDKEVERISGIHDRFNAVLARNPKYQQNFTKGLEETAKKSGLARHELQNLAYQVNDVVVSLGSGQKPMQVFLQQGAQIGQIFGTSGVGAGAILRQLGGIVARLIPPLLAFAAVIGVVTAPFALFTREFNKGVDSKKLVDGLKLTEDQLKKLKKSGEETRVTFGDTFKATFQVIGQYATQYFKPVTEWVVKWWNKALDFITTAFSVWVRIQLGMWLSFANVIKAVWKDIPAAVEAAAKGAANGAISIIEFAINQISKAVADSPLGKLLGMSGPVEIKLPRLELSADAKNMQSDVKDAIVNGYKQADTIVTKFGNDVRAQALKNAQDRLKAAAGEDDSKGKKSRGFDRAKELAQINAELDSQAKNMFVLATARDAANRADEIALRFAKEGQPLREEEIDSLRKKIQALNDAKEVQTQFDRIYQNATGPLREYNASLAAADKLVKMGAISQAQYVAEVNRAKEAFASASDPLHDMNKELDEQIKLLGMLGPQREVEQQVLQAMNKALQEGKPLRDDEIKALREKLKLVQQLNIVSSMRDELQQGSQAQRSVNTATRTQTAIGEVGNNGFTGGDAISALAQENPALEATREFQQQTIASYTDMYAQIDALRQADLISETSAIQARMELFQQQYSKQIEGATTALGALATLQNSQNKKQAAIGKKAAIAQTLIQTYQSATAAFSAMAGIPYVGPFLGAAAAAAAIAAGMANVQQIRAQNAGFKEGGYTGNIPTNSIAGSVHGKEYVFDAPATARIGVGNLEALRRGRIPVDSLGTGQSGAVTDASPTPTRVGSDQINYNQTVNVTVAGKRDRRTAEQEARAIRTQSTRELIRSGG